MRTITFVYPSKTAVISVTGNNCELNCKHCRKRHLEHMNSISGFDRKAESVLLSGGFNRSGSVPIKEEHLKELENYRINAHSGLVDEFQAKLLGKYAHSVSFDFPAGSEVIENVYGLNKTMSDYIQSYKLLKIHCKKVVPHICIGLGGNEIKAVNALADIGFDEIVFLALMPNEYFRNPPSIEKLIAIMRK
ncbi:radical SAM protein, partial [Candidatus Woesearchaeota archaeon]|nr:radical SAM protein [Candidatus Woesearchaeota archaeon]